MKIGKQEMKVDRKLKKGRIVSIKQLYEQLKYNNGQI